ncbi:MAG: hypothetical protein ISR65_12275 [Bacteriovoracaceae bacterium]|nr:hypothetical protein [Bacteriovoracaceae bacterium]
MRNFKKIILLTVVTLIIAFLFRWLTSGHDRPYDGEQVDAAQLVKKSKKVKKRLPRPRIRRTRQVEDEDEDAREKKKKQKLAKSKKKKVSDEAEVLKGTEEGFEEFDDYFDQVETKWIRSAKQFLQKDLKLDNSTWKEYQRIRESYQEDKIDAYQEFHEYMQEKHGDSYAYDPEDPEEFFGREMRQGYLERIRGLFGEENYSRYVDLKEQYNNSIQDEWGDEYGAVTIDL